MCRAVAASSDCVSESPGQVKKIRFLSLGLLPSLPQVTVIHCQFGCLQMVIMTRDINQRLHLTDEESETQRGTMTSLRSHRNILYVKIMTVDNVKLTLLAIFHITSLLYNIFCRFLCIIHTCKPPCGIPNVVKNGKEVKKTCKQPKLVMKWTTHKSLKTL